MTTLLLFTTPHACKAPHAAVFGTAVINGMGQLFTGFKPIDNMQPTLVAHPELSTSADYIGAHLLI